VNPGISSLASCQYRIINKREIKNIYCKTLLVKVSHFVTPLIFNLFSQNGISYFISQEAPQSRIALTRPGFVQKVSFNVRDLLQMH